MSDPQTLKSAMDDPKHGFWAFTGEDEADETAFLNVLAEFLGAMDKARIPYVLIGGIASTVLGRSRLTRDIDIFVKPDDADRVIAVMEQIDFATQRTDPNWIFKGFKDGVIIDVIFKSQGGVYLDETMLRRALRRTFHGIPVCLAPPEDLLVMKAIAADEDSPRHWHDALGLLSCGDVEFDWDYVAHRSRHGLRRVLSLLLYAQADDLPVPDYVVPKLFALLQGDASAVAGGTTHPTRFVRR